MLYITPENMAAAERSCGVPLYALMERAGEALAGRISRICRKNMYKRVLFLCGRGNNAGDGFVAARILSFEGTEVSVMLCCGTPQTELAAKAFSRLSDRVRFVQGPAELDGFDVIADCIYGTGFHGELPCDVQEVIHAANSCGAYRIACDLPSGVNALTGEAADGFMADETAAMQYVKLGCALSPAKGFCGRTYACDIGIGTDSSLTIESFDAQQAGEALPYRPPYGHKGTFGKVAAIVGSERYTGAAAMAVSAAIRSGAGLVYCLSTEKVADRLSGSLFEPVYVSLPSDGSGFISSRAADRILSETGSADSILFGCGTGNTADGAMLLELLLKNAGCPLIIDADGINCLAVNIDILRSRRAEVILTPHAGELARLTGKKSADRYGSAKAIAERYGVTVMAKGPETLIAGPDGCALCSRGNTALSKGGSGDILAGLTAGFAAQGASRPCELASVCLGMTAERLSLTMSQRGIAARDIINALPETLLSLEM